MRKGKSTFLLERKEENQYNASRSDSFMNRTTFQKIAVAVVIGGTLTAAQAQSRPQTQMPFLHPLFSNHAVLQRDLEVPVSMNMWALTPEIFEILEREFNTFLANLDKDDLKQEYLLPTIIGSLLDDGVVEVKVLQSHDNWFGVTYKEDKESVVNSIQELIRDGVYPQKLF